jgi:hypothetical protein
VLAIVRSPQFRLIRGSEFVGSESIAGDGNGNTGGNGGKAINE